MEKENMRAEPILLQCGCWKEFSRPVPEVGELLNCRTHGAAKVIHSVNYKIHCVGCRFRRYVGNAPLTAEVRAVKHSLTKHHAVRIIKYVDSKHDSETTVGGSPTLTLDESVGS